MTLFDPFGRLPILSYFSFARFPISAGQTCHLSKSLLLSVAEAQKACCALVSQSKKGCSFCTNTSEKSCSLFTAKKTCSPESEHKVVRKTRIFINLPAHHSISDPEFCVVF